MYNECVGAVYAAEGKGDRRRKSEYSGEIDFCNENGSGNDSKYAEELRNSLLERKLLFRFY